LTERDASAPTAGFSYPEWDVHRGRYRSDWCTVVESLAPIGDATPHAPDVVALRRALARLGVGLTPVHRRAQGEDIDIDAAVDAYIDRKAGIDPTPDTYVESVRRRRDLSVLVLLDVSGSAAEAGVGPGSVHEAQQRAALALVTALDDLGDRVGLYAFNSRGRHSVQVARVKDFARSFDAGAARRLQALRPAGFTRLGTAIRHAAATLAARGGTPRQLLVVISDGFAYDHGYQGRYGEADAHRALSEARRRGIGCLCLSVGAVTDTDALRRVFGPAAHASIPRVEQLAATIGPLFRDALASAGVAA
jgi:nitric oxide reductase activation protein